MPEPLARSKSQAYCFEEALWLGREFECGGCRNCRAPRHRLYQPVEYAAAGVAQVACFDYPQTAAELKAPDLDSLKLEQAPTFFCTDPQETLEATKDLCS